MKGVWVAGLLVLLCGCNFFRKPNAPLKSPATVMIDEGGWVPTGNDDLDTMAISLLDFMKQGRMTHLVDGVRSTVVINRLTNGTSDYISAEQIGSETRRVNVPVGVIASLQTRNADTHEVTWIPPGLPFFVSDLSVLPENLVEMSTAMPNIYPKAFAAIWLWMPGYSEDGTWAMVRFTFAPTANGAVATYLLNKDDTGKWRISNRGMNYFVAPGAVDVIVSGDAVQFVTGWRICKITAAMLSRLTIPGLFITGTDTGVGKTVIAGAIANWFHRNGKQVAVCKLAATGCVRRREGLVSEDAEFLAVCSSSRHPLDMIAPQHYAEPLAPAIAAERAKRPLDWFMINNSIRLMSQGSDVMIVEGVGGILVPMDDKHTVLDAAVALGVPAVIVARAGLGTISHTLLTLRTLRSAGVRVAGVVINEYPSDLAGAAEESNPRAIQRWGEVPVLCIVPREVVTNSHLPAGITAAVDTVDWQAHLKA